MEVEAIIRSGCCIGCGTCASNPDDGVAISFDEHGKYQADVSGASSTAAEKILSVCPFSNKSANEDRLGRQLFRDARHDPRIGYFRSLYIGYVAEGTFRDKATSGGLITWLLTQLLASKEIDGVIHVRPTPNPSNGCLFEYAVSTDTASVLAGAKSRYYPVEASKVLQYVRVRPGRYAFVGVPCFIKSVRNLMCQDDLFAERIRYCVGLVCGHLKSKAFADCFAWQAGILPGQLEQIDFRVKQEKGSAGDYAVRLRGAGKEVLRPTRSFLGSVWGHNFFRYEACDYCDDIFAETADISVGDAWLEPYSRDPKGTSVVVVRNAPLAELIAAAAQKGSLHLDEAAADDVALSQAGGLRDRREGLAYRLFLKERYGRWAPQKRVAPSGGNLSIRRKRIYRHRSRMARMSHLLWAEAVSNRDITIFEKTMTRMAARNGRLYQPFAFRLYAQTRSILVGLYIRTRSILKKVGL